MINPEKIKTCLLNYKNLTAKIDEKCLSTFSLFSNQIKCRKGCSDCCRLETVFPVEAFSIALEIITGNIAFPEKNTGEYCTFLENGLCSIYDARPIICRTHGLPIFFEDNDGNRRADCCPLNFNDAESLNSRAFIDIDKINTILYSVNSLFIKELALPFAEDERIRLIDIAEFI